jgi:cytochrome c biogenesis protein CcmG, thiol:disulfide interchange protein DsbE
MSVEQITATTGRETEHPPLRSRRFAYLAPLAAFMALAIILAWGMSRDPGAIPSALIDKAVPQFSLPPVEGRKLGLSSSDLSGEVSLVNVFAPTVVDETLLPLIRRLREQ